MKTHLFPCLGAFVAGVFVGAGLWFALIVCAALVVAWHVWLNPSAPDRPSFKHISHFGPRRRGGGY